MRSGTPKSWLRAVALFLLPRYPLSQALTLLLFIAERVHINSAPPFPPNAIYIYIASMFVCSVGMGITSFRSFFSIATSILMFFSAGVIFLNESLQYRKWVKIRAACGMLGVGATFLFYAYFGCKKPRLHMLKRMAEVSMCLYAALGCYILIKSPEDRSSFLQFVPFGQTSLFIFVLLLGTSSLCYLLGIHVFDFNFVVCILCLFKLLVVDIHIGYWHTRRGIDFWNQVRMIIDNVAITIGGIFYSTCFKRIESNHLKIN